MYRYRLFDTEWNDAGEAEYAVNIKPGEIIWANGNRKLRVLEAAAGGIGARDRGHAKRRCSLRPG